MNRRYTTLEIIGMILVAIIAIAALFYLLERCDDGDFDAHPAPAPTVLFEAPYGDLSDLKVEGKPIPAPMPDRLSALLSTGSAA